MGDAPVGIRYEEARKKAKRFARINKGDLPTRNNVISSLINQARLCEGEGAAREIIKEVGETAKAFSGIGNAQIGIGDGEKFESGRYVWENGKLVKL